MDRVWLKQYPKGVPADIDTSTLPSLVTLLEQSFARFRERRATLYMGQAHRYGEIDEFSLAFAAYLQSLGLARGDRVAIMLPNVPQYLAVTAAILRAGYVVVNINPLYTAREVEYQLNDAGAVAIVILENFAATLQQVLHRVTTRHVVVAALGDLLPLPKRWLVHAVVRHVHKRVPAFHLPQAVRFMDAVARGRALTFTPVAVGPDDVAVLQYTGGTTGVSKGAVLLHRNLVANVLQAEAWYQPALSRIPPGEQIVKVCALPLYHIFGFTATMLLSLRMGACCLLIPNARDIKSLLKTLSTTRFHVFPAVNTLFTAIARHADFDTVDWQHLKLSVGGGMAVQPSTAQLWLDKTGCPVCEGYGLSETSPTVTCNATDSSAFNGTIGLPVPGTDIRLVDDAGRDVPLGAPGELAVRGPQLMAGYWQRPDETAVAMTADGYFRTGDIATVDERGYVRIVDRKKDMILVSGFNVYPNEIEAIVTQLPGVLECAVIGIADASAGEAVKLVVVRDDIHLDEAQIRRHCEANLTGYKRPKVVEFRQELPKTAVGKILRRELREPS